MMLQVKEEVRQHRIWRRKFIRRRLGGWIAQQDIWLLHETMKVTNLQVRCKKHSKTNHLIVKTHHKRTENSPVFQCILVLTCILFIWPSLSMSKSKFQCWLWIALVATKHLFTWLLIALKRRTQMRGDKYCNHEPCYDLFWFWIVKDCIKMQQLILSHLQILDVSKAKCIIWPLCHLYYQQ